jgi:hypothetical protein
MAYRWFPLEGIERPSLGEPATTPRSPARRPRTDVGLGLAARLPAIIIEAADLPDDELALLETFLDLTGTSGDPNAGDPIQYDELRIEHDQGDVEIIVYNRAILLFRADSGEADSPGVLPAG